MEVLSANWIKWKIVEVQKDWAIVLYEWSNGPTFTKYENLKTFEFTKDMEVLSANWIKWKIVEVQKDWAIVLYEWNTTPTFTKYENLKTFESLMKKDFKQKKSATEKNKKQEVQIKDEEIISQDNQPIKIEIPPELINIDWQEFKLQAWKILDLNDMWKYQIAKVETTDGWFYIIKPLGKWEYEILSSKPQVPTWQKVWILETDWAMHFDMQSSLWIKTIQEVVLLNPIVKNKISVIEKPVIKHANIYENEIELQKLVNNKLNEYNNLREPFNEKYFDETKNEYILDENWKKDYDYIINLREEIKYDLWKLTTIKEWFIQLDGIFGKIEKPQNIKIPNISWVFEKDIIRSDWVKEKIYVNKDILKDILVESNWETVRYGTNRLFILAKVWDTIIPFYRSSEGTSWKTTGKWYPFFGETEHWIVKWTVESDWTMEYNNKELTAVTDIINKNFIIPPDMLFTGFKKWSNNSESAEDFTQVENLLIAPIGGTYDDCISLDDIVWTHVLFKTWTSNDFTGFHPNEKLINRGGGYSKIRYDNIVNRIWKKNPIMIDKDVVKKNAALNDSDRIKEAKNILWYNVSLLQEQAILEAHKLPGEIYNLSLAEIRAKVEVLKKAEFTSEQIRVLMENGICWTDGLSDNSGVEGAVMNNNVSSKSKESDSGIKTEMENKEVINKSSPEIVNKNILNESIILEKDLILIDKELNDPVDKTSNDNVSFVDKASKFATFLTKVDVYTKSIEKIAAQKDVLFEKTNTFIKTNLQKMKEVLMHRPKHIIKEINHIQAEIAGYADAYKNTSWFLSKSAHALGILRTSLHPLMEVRHKVNNVMEYFEWEYDHEKSEAMSMMIKSVNHSLFEAELGLIRIDERIKTKKIEQHFELKIDELHLAIQNPSEYISLLYDIIIENPKFGYNEQHMQEIKTLTNNINFNEPISEDVHNDILGLLFSNVKPQIH